MPPRVGSRVVVGILGVEGRVLSLHDEQAEVDVRGKRLRVAIRDLRVLDEGSRGQPSMGSSSSHVTVNVRRPDGLLPDLNVIGCNVDEAQTRVEQHLDQALLREQRHLRIIHGHGTGQLRRSIAALLEHHPLVDRFSLAPPDQGGGGVTLVELKE